MTFFKFLKMDETGKFKKHKKNRGKKGGREAGGVGAVFGENPPLGFWGRASNLLPGETGAGGGGEKDQNITRVGGGLCFGGAGNREQNGLPRALGSFFPVVGFGRGGVLGKI